MNDKETKQKNFIEKEVLAFCEKQNMFCEADKVVVGVSGGADSVCLLTVLHALAPQLGIRLVAAHLNHGVRKTAAQDAAYVEKLCETLSIPYYEKTVDVPSIAKQKRLGEEVVGRMERYTFFEEVRHETDATLIAVAHNKNDRAETVLFHLFRGSGATGLAGIRPKRDTIVRPLLCLGREQIEEYLDLCNITYCHDDTNDTDDYARNRIRHHILSYAKQEICDGVVENICNTAVHMERMHEYIQQQTTEAISRCEDLGQKHPKRRTFLIDKLQKEAPLIQENIIFETLKAISEDGKDIYRIHVEAVMGLVQNPGNRQVNISNAIVASRSYDLLTLERYADMADEKDASVFLEISKENLSKEPLQLAAGEKEITLQLLDFDGQMEAIVRNAYTKWLDYDKIDDKLFIRTRQIGDYFMVKVGDTICHKRLKSFFIDEKVPPQNRDKQLLLASQNHILCLLPGRISEACKVTPQTKTILQISIEERCH